MNSRLFAVSLACVLVSAAVAGATEQEIRVFQLRFRTTVEAVALVEPLLSDQGSLVLPRGVNALTVRDRSAVLRRIADALAEWDVPPQNYLIRIRLLLASSPTPAPGRASPLIEGIGAEISKVFGFTSYQEIDTLQVAASDGATVEAVAGERYHLRFMVRGVPHDAERIHLSQFELSRRERSGEGRDRPHILMKGATISLKEDQEVVVALARSEAANRGLILVVWAQREGKQ